MRRRCRALTAPHEVEAARVGGVHSGGLGESRRREVWEHSIADSVRLVLASNKNEGDCRATRETARSLVNLDLTRNSERSWRAL